MAEVILTHTHEVNDTELNFVIDPITKEVVPGAGSLTLAQHAKNSERFTFELASPTVEGHDMSICDSVMIHFRNISQDQKKISEGIYKVTDLAFNDGKLTLSWLIGEEATVYAGGLIFSIHFACTNDLDEVVYNFPTLTFSKITVGATVWNSETIAKEYPDIIAQFDTRIAYLESVDPTAGSAVLYTKQTLTEERRAQARENIGAAAAVGEGGGSVDAGAVLYTEQNLTEEQKAQARENIGALSEIDVPVKGVDYWTPEDKEEITAEANALIATELAKRGQLKPEFANSIEECTDTSKLYVLPDGYIYAYMYTISSLPNITIEAKTGGYWRYTSNGFVWNEQSGINTKLSNMIPVTPGDQLSYQGQVKYGSNKSYIWFGASGEIIEAGLLSSLDAPTVLTAPAGAVAVQFTSFVEGATKEATLNVEWVLCQAAAPTYQFANTGHAFVPADYEGRIIALEENVASLEQQVNAIGESVTEPLYAKKIVYDGDSICYGAGYVGGYAKIIAELTGGSFVNQAVGGGRLVTKGSNSWYSVVDNLPNLPKDGAIYCFEGGINDYWTSGMQLGTFDNSNYEGELDTSTVCGALETIFRYALNNFVGKPVCFVITHKIQQTAFRTNTSGNTFKEYHDAMVGICQKYSIPYYDAFNESGLNGWNAVHNANFFTDGDGCHPTKEGYKRYYVPQLMALFRRIMPVE